MKLLEPIQIGPIMLKNRMVMAPMATQFATFEGFVTDQIIHYYIERAKGGVGLITTESCAVRFDGRGLGRRLGIYKDEMLSGLSRLTRAIHNNGSKVVVQLHHGGRICSSKGIFEYPISSSSIPCPFYGGNYFIGIIPRTLSKMEIIEIEKSFAMAARRAEKAGFDGVQIHAAHGYLINNFLSPLVNKRSDEYGGSFKNRLRFLLEIVESVRNVIGDRLALSVRINGEEFIDHGYGIEEGVLIAQELEKKGVDEISISAGNYEAIERQIPPMSFPPGCHVSLAGAVKKSVRIPVGTVGRINDPELAEKIVREKKADLIYMGRTLIADPEFPRKVMEGRPDEIRRCIACNRCIARIFEGLDMGCSVNAAVGGKDTFHLTKRKRPKTVVIVGGGPAGMEAARISALRNHKVILFERQKHLGGSLTIAGRPRDRSEIFHLKDFLIGQMNQLSINVMTGIEFKPKMMGKLKPDVVVLATGSLPIVPRIKGIGSNHVKLAEETLRTPVDKSNSVVIIGGGLVGCEVAGYLLDEGVTSITVVEILDDIASDEENISKKVLVRKLMENGVRVLLETQVARIEKRKVLVKNKIGERSYINADAVIIATGYRPDQRLYNKLLKIHSSLPSKLFSIGDCSKTGKIYDAIHGGFNLGLKI